MQRKARYSFAAGGSLWPARTCIQQSLENPLHQDGLSRVPAKGIIPRWGRYALNSIRAGEIELWLRSLPLARSTCAKIRNVMSVVFNHGLRHELLDRNPVQWVRQSAKRKKIPVVLEIGEVQSLLGALDLRERTMVLLDVVTGLRASELFGLKWIDVNFNNNEISVTRSIVNQVIGSCKTEASQKPVPLDPVLARTLRTWRAHTRYKAATDWVFASPYSQGRRPYWCQSLMRNRISVVAHHVGITKKIGWHTFRHYAACGIVGTPTRHFYEALERSSKLCRS